MDILNIEEVCKAFIDDKKLIDRYGDIYTRDGGGFLGDDGIETPYPFMYPANMAIYEEYNLTFQQAMSIASSKRVKNEKSTYIFHMRDGRLYTEHDIIMGLDVCEIGSKWKVIE